MPTLGGQEGQELPFILTSFYLSYLLKGHLPVFWTAWLKETFIGQVPRPPSLHSVNRIPIH